jgi:hypothetical protein
MVQAHVRYRINSFLPSWIVGCSLFCPKNRHFSGNLQTEVNSTGPLTAGRVNAWLGLSYAPEVVFVHHHDAYSWP